MVTGMAVERALLSVSDKSGIVDFARFLAKQGVEIISSGGTARVLGEAGLSVTKVSEVTGFPQMLGGRVKTLHPHIHGGILADPDQPSHRMDLRRHGIDPFQLVVCNLYPFEDGPAVDQIDIGGVAMLRAAAKNHAHVAVVCSPRQYSEVMEALRTAGVGYDLRRRLAAEAFAHTAAYDAAIASWMSPPGVFPDPLVMTMRLEKKTRYGENPHQQGALYSSGNSRRWAGGIRQLQGKAMSYNNYADAEAAMRLVFDLPEPGCVIVKHANPCGVGAGKDAAQAFARAWESDRRSAFGGVVAFNRPLDAETASAVRAVFVEVVAAPSVEPQALRILSERAGLRVLETPSGGTIEREVRSLGPDYLVQSPDRVSAVPEDWRVVSARRPDSGQLAALRLAWIVAAHARSNAVTICREGRTVGVGAGDQSRVGAAERALRTAGGRARGAVAASDGFLPFRDGLDVLASGGVTAVVSPGGSVRDTEVIAAADEHRMVLLFTGRRHFRH